MIGMVVLVPMQRTGSRGRAKEVMPIHNLGTAVKLELEGFDCCLFFVVHKALERGMERKK
jgi:hypothetical protein